MIKRDCRYFLGDKPCSPRGEAEGKFRRNCFGCPNYSKVEKRILIIKFAALGDVLRTTPLLYGLKGKFPNSYISWLTSHESADILKGNPLIDELLVFNLASAAALSARKFDLLVNLDKDKTAAGMASLIAAKKKKGFGLEEDGRIYPFDKDSEYAFRLGLDDELKFKKNKKTYQEIIFEQAGLKYKKEEYVLYLSDEEKAHGASLLRRFGALDGKLKIGLNTGAGRAFAGKKLPIEKYVDLARKLTAKLNAHVLLLGGPDEFQRNKKIKEDSQIPVINAGTNHTIRQFASIVESCDVVLTGDTVALHVAISVATPVVALFGSTSAQEIELYGRGRKIASRVSCAPCYRRYCDKDEECMKRISTDEILEAISGVIKK